jgi:hypothetical protein
VTALGQQHFAGAIIQRISKQDIITQEKGEGGVSRAVGQSWIRKSRCMHDSLFDVFLDPNQERHGFTAIEDAMLSRHKINTYELSSLSIQREKQMY